MNTKGQLYLDFLLQLYLDFLLQRAPPLAPKLFKGEL